MFVKTRSKQQLHFTVLFSMILNLSCAEPKYVKGPQNITEGKTAQEAKADCQTTFSVSGLCLAWRWEKNLLPPKWET